MRPVIEVELTDAARDDLIRLRDHLRARHGEPLTGEFAELEDDETVVAVQRGAIAALVGIRDNPWAGAENRARTGSRHIVDGRHLYFDRDGYTGRHPADKRFRIIYRLEPDEGTPNQSLRVRDRGTREPTRLPARRTTLAPRGMSRPRPGRGRARLRPASGVSTVTQRRITGPDPLSVPRILAGESLHGRF